MRVRLSRWWSALIVTLCLGPVAAWAEAEPGRFSAGGYFRVMSRPDLQGGNGSLGFWNLYGRLLNEGPYAALEMRLDVLRNPAGHRDPWAAVQARIEGGSVANADAGNGGLANFRLSQLYVRAGNILLDRVTWQLGTQESYFGELGLYDMRPAQLFEQMLGLSARYEVDRFDLLLAVGDSGYALRGSEYDPIATVGGSVRVRLVPAHLELGTGGQYALEPKTPGDRFAPYDTPDITWEQVVRREVVRDFLAAHPGEEDFFPRPIATQASSWKVVGYLGFGGFGPVTWNNFFIHYAKRHPDRSYVEHFNGRDFTIYITSLTDQRYELTAGDEVQLRLVPGRLEAVWAGLYGRDVNLDNTVQAGEDNREYLSTVLRLQLYLTQTTHLLLENALAKEVSLNGNLYRNHVDSVFENDDGFPDSRGLQFGDSDTRITWQFKTGIVLNPTGPGIYTRPSLRLLYGLQYSTQQQAFGSGYVSSLDQYNVFGTGPEQHWHSLVAIEAEGWF
ncbi:MAG: hypothetical protein IRZ16_07185 [Myxococcaceae bacterium]|nr:hypothetical protein [Myxococcaceae bacterium]